VSLHGKKRLGKKDKKGDVVTRFLYTLKNLHMVMICKKGDKGKSHFEHRMEQEMQMVG
jgi:hypothetical protein